MLLKLGSTGGDVSAWQTVLYKVGYTDIVIDGSFGPITDGFTREYQSMLGLPADGVVGDETLAAHKAANPGIEFAVDTTLAEQAVKGEKSKNIWLWILGGSALAAIAVDFFGRKKRRGHHG